MTDTERFGQRLETAGVGLCRFIPIRGNGPNPKAPANGRNPHRFADVDGSYGVELGDGLAVIDVDNPEVFNADIPETLTVSTPHSDIGHLYVTVDNGPSGAAPGWGEFKTAGEYVVGPGSEIRSCGKCGHCSDETPGQYRIVEDRSIAHVDAELVAELQDRTEAPSESEQSRTVRDSSPPDALDGPTPSDAGNDLTDTEVIAVATDADDPKFPRLWNGDTAGYPSQSEADLALCNKLAFYTAGDPQQMARLVSQSGLYRDKWDRRDYRDRTIALAIRDTTAAYHGGHKPTVTPPGNANATADGGRDQVSEPLIDSIYETLSEDGPLRTAAVADQIDYHRNSERQVRRALNHLKSWGYVTYERSGRSGAWHCDETPPR